MAQRSLLIGIDSGTQSTKALIVDAVSGRVLGEGSAPHTLLSGLPAGAKEQDPAQWVRATTRAIQAALKSAKAKATEVVAIGVSGQQHGFVALDAQDRVIRPPIAMDCRLRTARRLNRWRWKDRRNLQGNRVGDRRNSSGFSLRRRRLRRIHE